MTTIRIGCRRGFARRRFLILTGGVATTCACSSRIGAPPAPVGDLAAGNVADLPVGSLQVVGTEPACVGRDALGVYAMTLTCTHAGCDMGEEGSVSPTAIRCGCHGSEFDANGAVLRGPAMQPLDHFAVTVDSSGDVTIHGAAIVDASVRLAV